MQLTIDTVAKTVKVNEPIKVSSLINELKKLFPDDWDEFNVIPDVRHHYMPQYTPPPVYGPPWPTPDPTWPPWEITCKDKEE